MEKRIFISLLTIGTISIILTAFIALSAFHSYADNQAIENLKSDIVLVEAAMEEGCTDEQLLHLFHAGGERRLTVIEADGTVSFDTEHDIETMDSHADRPEFVGAVLKGMATGKRSSDTFGKTVYYCALKRPNGQVLRISMSTEKVTSAFYAGMILIILIAGALLLASIRLSKWLTAQIIQPVKLLANNLESTDATLPDPEKTDPELRPLVEKIGFQRNEIYRQLGKVETERNRLSAIINNMDEGLFILGNDMRILILNDSACRFMGMKCKKDECIGMRLREVCEDGAMVDCIEKCRSTKLSVNGRSLQVHVKNHVTSTGDVGRIGLMMDVTERTELERMKQEFTANVSHELKTPLTSISGYAEMIESGMASGDDIPQFAGRIRKESARLLTLISDIIKLSRLDCAAEVGEYTDVDFTAVCRECMDMLELAAKKNSVTLSFAGNTEGTEDSSVWVRGSRSELCELVYNLIDNAIRYNRIGGNVTVGLDKQISNDTKSPIITLSVSDTGIGIPKEHISRVFERFYRVDKSRSKATGGTGLGLAIVRHVAERHHAGLDIQSEVGKGTTVSVVFGEELYESF